MALQRVYIIWKHPLFRESVQMLLDHPEVDIVGSNSDYFSAQEDILGIQPDTILVEEVEGVLHSQAMEILESSPWDVQVVGFSLIDNKMSVYHHEQRVVAEGDDLLRLIVSDST